jgi:hypothetical protein
MPTTCSASELVTLREGLSVSVAALRLLWDLEDRHFTLHVDEAGLHVRPGKRLTPGDCTALQVYKVELAWLVQHYGGEIIR